MQSVAKNVESHEKRLSQESADYLRTGFPAPAAAQTPLGYVDGVYAILVELFYAFFLSILFSFTLIAMHDISLSVSLSFGGFHI